MALVLNGSSQYGYKTGVSLSYPYSISAWVKCDSDTASGLVVSVEKQSSADYNIIMAAGSIAGDPIRAATYNTSWCNADSTTGYTTGTWLHVLGVFASATSRAVYLNGGNKGTNTTSQTAAGDDLVVGAYKRGAESGFFDGKICHLAIWDIALGDSDATALAAGTAPNEVQSSDLIHWLPLISDGDDDVGSANLTLVGSPTFDSDTPAFTVDLAASGGGTGGGSATLSAAELVDLAASGGGTGGGSATLTSDVLPMWPVELYTITMGATIWRHCNNVDDALVVSGNTFIGEAITRGDITDTRDELTIKLPADHAYPALLIGICPSTPVSVLIQWLNRNSNPGSLRVIYKGWVKSVKFSDDGQIAELYLESIVSGLAEEICDDTFCVGCQVPLFSTQCGLNKEDFKYDGTVTVVDGNTITIPGLTTLLRPDGWALPGMVKFGSDWRQVFAQDEDVLTLSLPFYDDVEGETVTVYRGCDHTITMCNDDFDNAENYRGFPYMPKQNVFLTGLQ